MACFLRFVVYCEPHSSVGIDGLHIPFYYLCDDSFVLLVCSRECGSVKDVDLFFLLVLYIAAVPCVYYLLCESVNVLLTKAVVDQDFGGALDLVVDLLPRAAVRERPPDIGADGGVLIFRGAFTSPVQTKARVCGLAVHACGVSSFFLLDEDV